MTKKNYVMSFSCDKDLIADIDYLAKTQGSDEKRSALIASILRKHVPQRSLSVSSPIED